MVRKVEGNNFNQLNAELDGLIVDLQSSSIDVDKMLEKYKRGMQIIQELNNSLKKTKLEIEKIKIKFS